MRDQMESKDKSLTDAECAKIAKYAYESMRTAIYCLNIILVLGDTRLGCELKRTLNKATTAKRMLGYYAKAKGHELSGRQEKVALDEIARLAFSNPECVFAFESQHIFEMDEVARKILAES